ncbi:MAG: O-antigen ligase family protein [Alphaproteobacteria bacterium]|uniref:O-antigen ligase family protein n=1 Tax=Candidatus Nitrobium versatile TaxID=2884831 RepID=A0A953M0Z5_9BACT|nr:O-antigen ligase family protein [Candidatus Nitrobium versatile]
MDSEICPYPSGNGSAEEERERGRFWFVLTLLYLVMEYARPMDHIPGLGLLRPGLVIGVLLGISWFMQGNFASLWSRQTAMILLFVTLLVVHIPFARNNFYAYNSAKGVLLYMPFLISVLMHVDSFKRLRTLFTVWILLMGWLSVSGIAGKGKGGGNFLADENDFSLLMNMMLPFGLFLLMYERSCRRKMLYLAASVLAVLSIVVSFSRGGFVGLVAVLFVVWLFSSRKILTLALTGVLALVLFFGAGSAYWEEMSTITDQGETTAKERLLSWEAAWDMFLDNPQGVGGSNFPVRFAEYQDDGFTRGMWGRAAHSLWFTLISELGIPGILIYTALLLFNVRDLSWLRRLRERSGDDDVRYASYLSLAFSASLVGFFVSGTFLSVLYYPHYFYLTAMIVVTRRVAEQRIGSYACAPTVSCASRGDDTPVGGWAEA